jgi:hypothetical protein
MYICKTLSFFDFFCVDHALIKYVDLRYLLVFTSYSFMARRKIFSLIHIFLQIFFVAFDQ